MLIKTLLALLVVVVILAGGAIAGNKVPLRQLPGPLARLMVYLSRNSAETRPDHVFPELRTRSYAMSRVQMLERIKAAIVELGWEIQTDEGDRYSVHAVVSTPLLQFKDDVYVTLREAANDRTAVHIASRSRVGRADFGANIGHIMALDEALGSGS
jgi:uncharacterized protein (DUF1499 family)